MIPTEVLAALEVGPAMGSTLEAAFHVSELLSAPLRCVHVTVPIPSVVALVMGKDKVAKAEENERESVAIQVEASAREWGLKQVPPLELVKGDPGGELSKLTSEERVLVLSVHGGGGASYGSTARRIVRAGVGPILCVQSGKKSFGAWKNVLVALDASDASKRALVVASELARREKAKLEALHVFEGPTRGLVSLFEAESEIAAAVERVRGEVAKEMQPVLDAVKPAPKLHLVDGYHPARRIVPFAQLGRYDLIVMGSRIDPRRRDMVLGSVADELVGLATQDVLIVKSAV